MALGASNGQRPQRFGTPGTHTYICVYCWKGERTERSAGYFLTRRTRFPAILSIQYRSPTRRQPKADPAADPAFGAT